MARDEELIKITDRLPENEEVCKSILEMLNNGDVAIEKDDKSTTSLYLVMQNKIVIGNIKENFARIQTIAHECIHSVQNKKILKFNYIFSNIYLLYFWIIVICALFRNPSLLEARNIFLIILIIFGCVYYIVRGLLEVDAMTRAPFIAKQYMKNTKLLSKEEIDLICKKYDELNRMGIPIYIFILGIKTVIKMVIYCALLV